MSDFKMPSMGADMDEGTLLEWKIKPGDSVSKGQVIAVVDTSKVAIDIEVFEDGVIEELLIEEGDTVDVGTVIARIGDGSSQQQSQAQQKTSRPEPAETKHETESESEPEREPEPEPGDKTETAEKKQHAAKSDSAPDQAVKKSSQPAAWGERQKVSPAARRKASELGLDLATIISGSGVDGAVVLADLEQAAKVPKVAGKKPAAGFDKSEMRRSIAAAMSRSKREIPHYYLANTVDLHKAEQWLEAYNHDRPPAERLLLAALLMKAIALALAKYPDLNGHYHEQGFVAADAVNLGMAVHLRGGGLVAPAILDADKLLLPELMQRLQDMVNRARGGGLRGSEISGGTATVTALGDRGVDTVYGVIYPPQVAMIGTGRPGRRVLAVGDAIAVHQAVDISLAADHRVCDGHLGALFLNEIDRLLQQPEAL